MNDLGRIKVIREILDLRQSAQIAQENGYPKTADKFRAEADRLQDLHKITNEELEQLKGEES